MSDKHKDLARGAQAEKLLKNRLLKEALASIKEAAHSEFEDCDSADAEQLLRVRLILDMAKKFELMLENAVSLGKSAEFELEQERKRRKQDARNIEPGIA